MRYLLSFAIVSVLIFGCSKSNPDPNPVNPGTDTSSAPINAPVTENFESGTKTDFASSSIQLNTGKWFFDNAIIGTEAGDKKNGNKSARIGESGKISMNFDIVNGIYSVVISSATYNTDGASGYQLWSSTNDGATYSLISTVAVSHASLRADTVIVNIASKARFQIRKNTGGSNQLNIDDVKFIRNALPPAAATNDDDNLLMGNPSAATFSVLDYTNYLMVKPYYALSYNRDQGKANWVSWHLHMPDLGTTPRQDDFREDPTLPAGWYRVTYSSYSNGGFDRGHYCPSADRTASVPMNSSTFLMTNMMPQASQVNQRAWGILEDSCRKLVQAGKELFIIAGSYGSGGTGNTGFATSIDEGRVTVPATLWKVVVVLPNGNNDLSRVNSSTRVIAISMPNDNGVNVNWKLYRTSVDAIESSIGGGFNLLSNLPTALQNVLESQIDNL